MSKRSDLKNTTEKFLTQTKKSLSTTNKSSEELKQIGYYVRPDQDKALAIKAIQEGTNKSHLIRQAIDLFLEK